MPDEQVDKFLKKQAAWDKKLRRSGFRDIEQGYDLGEYDASTFRAAADGDHGPSFQPLSTIDIDTDQPALLHETEQYLYWQEFLEKAYALDDSNKRKPFLRSVAEAGNLRKAILTKHRLNRYAAKRIIVRFCAANNMPPPGFHKKPEKKDPPPPCRTFTEQERKAYEIELKGARNGS